MISPDDLLRSVRPQRPPMPDHVRRAIDTRLNEAAAREAELGERDAHRQGSDRFDHDDDVVHGPVSADDVVPAPGSDDRSVAGRRRYVPMVAAAVLLTAGVVGAIALDASRQTPMPVATSGAGVEARPGNGSGSVDTAPVAPPGPDTGDAGVDQAPTSVPGIDPQIEAVLADLPTVGLDPERLAAALGRVSLPSADSASPRQQLTGSVISAVACAWLEHWHDAVVRDDADEAGRAVTVFAELDRWNALDGRGLRSVRRQVAAVADAVVTAGPSSVEADALAARLRPRVCDA